MRSALLTLACLLATPGFAIAQDSLPSDRAVLGVNFAGNRAIDNFTLSVSISTSQSSWQRRWGLPGFLGGERRYFDETEFRRDVLRIGVLYRQSGYFESKIDTIVRRTENAVRVRFVITEGEPVLVTRVVVSGAEHVIPTEELLADIPLHRGGPFNRYWLQASVDSIRSRLQNLGYPWVEVYRGYDEDRATRTAQVSFDVDPGPRSRIGLIAVGGTSRVSPGVVRRVTGLNQGELFRKDALARTQIELYRTDLFSHVAVAVPDTTPPTSAADSVVAVQIDVREGKLYGARAGAGWGALDCFRGLTGWTARNFLGGGRSLDLTGRLSKIGCVGASDPADSTWRTINYNATIALRQPSFPLRRTATALSVFAERRSELNAFRREGLGGELAVSQVIAWQTAVTLSYTLSRGRTLADPAIFCTLQNVCSTADAAFTGPRLESAIGVSLLRDGSNSPLDPSRGNMLSIQTKYSSPHIGSDTLSQFLKGVLDFASYHRLGRRGLFAWRVRVGGIFPTELGFTARRARYVSPDERLYAGGPNTVRGYGQNELGPLVRVRTLPDSSIREAPTGGTRLVVANAEARAPLFQLFGARWVGAVFLDAGQVYDPDRTGAERRLRYTPGAGLRIGTPLGPLRFDVAYRPYEPTASPLYDASNGQLTQTEAAYVPPPPEKWYNRIRRHWQFNFSVGQAF